MGGTREIVRMTATLATLLQDCGVNTTQEIVGLTATLATILQVHGIVDTGDSADDSDSPNPTTDLRWSGCRRSCG